MEIDATQDNIEENRKDNMTSYLHNLLSQYPLTNQHLLLSLRSSKDLSPEIQFGRYVSIVENSSNTEERRRALKTLVFLLRREFHDESACQALTSVRDILYNSPEGRKAYGLE